MPRFPPSGPTGRRSPSSAVLSRHYDFLPPIPRHFVAFARRYHKFALVHSLSRDKCHRVSLELVTRCLLPEFNCGNDRISQVPGRPQSSVCTCSSTPARRLAPDQVTLDAPDFRATAWPLLWERQRLSRKTTFRSSITWLSDSLSTLRHARYLTQRKTRFRSLVRRYRTGFSPAGSQSKVSDSHHVNHPPPPSFLAQPHQLLCGQSPFTA